MDNLIKEKKKSLLTSLKAQGWKWRRVAEQGFRVHNFGPSIHEPSLDIYKTSSVDVPVSIALGHEYQSNVNKMTIKGDFYKVLWEGIVIGFISKYEFSNSFEKIERSVRAIRNQAMGLLAEYSVRMQESAYLRLYDDREAAEADFALSIAQKLKYNGVLDSDSFANFQKAISDYLDEYGYQKREHSKYRMLIFEPLSDERDSYEHMEFIARKITEETQKDKKAAFVERFNEIQKHALNNSKLSRSSSL